MALIFDRAVWRSAEELKRRIWFTLGVLLIYRMGTYIPLPGIDPRVVAYTLQEDAGGILSVLNIFTGGALGRMSIFALNLLPYASSLIVVKVFTLCSPQRRELNELPYPMAGEARARIIIAKRNLHRYTRYGTVLLAIIQAYGVCFWLESLRGPSGPAAIEPSIFFRMITVMTLTAGSIWLMWLAEQVTERGVDDGPAVIVLSGIVASIPLGLTSLFELGRIGALSASSIVVILGVMVTLVALIVFMELAQRRVLVDYPKRNHGRERFGGDASYIPFALNGAGFVPVILASSLLLLLVMFANLNHAQSEWLAEVTVQLTAGKELYILLYVALILFFAFVYISILYNPRKTADYLDGYGGYIPGIRPGKNTVDYLAYVVTRITVIGAIYLAGVCVIPEILMYRYNLSFYFGGAILYIGVRLMIGLLRHIEAILRYEGMATIYEGMIRRAKLRGRRSV